MITMLNGTESSSGRMTHEAIRQVEHFPDENLRVQVWTELEEKPDRKWNATSRSKGRQNQK